MMKWYWDNFITNPTKFEEASPLRTKNLEGLAPAIIATANYDPLRDKEKAYAEKLEASGVEVVFENYENVNGFYGTGEMGQELMNKSVAFLIQKFKSKSRQTCIPCGTSMPLTCSENGKNVVN